MESACQVDFVMNKANEGICFQTPQMAQQFQSETRGVSPKPYFNK